MEQLPDELEKIILRYKRELENHMSRMRACNSLLILIERFNPRMSIECAALRNVMNDEKLTDEVIDMLNRMVLDTVGHCGREFANTTFLQGLVTIGDTVYDAMTNLLAVEV